MGEGTWKQENDRGKTEPVCTWREGQNAIDSRRDQRIVEPIKASD